MKTTNFLKSGLLSLSLKFIGIFTFYIISFPFCSNILSAQTPISGPGMQWFKDQWYGMPTEPQNASGEDWYYDFISYFEDNDLHGYAGIGFSSSVNDNGNFNCFDCSIGAVDEVQLERPGYEIGCSYPKIAEMDKFGNIEWYQNYTKGVGAFRAGIQLADESGYVAIGYITYEGGDGIRYNPGIVDQGLPLALSNCEYEQGKIYNLMYIIRTNSEGVLQSDAVYGRALPIDANLQPSQGYGIIQDEDQNLIITGFVFEEGIQKAYVMKINKDDLSIIWRKTIMPAGSFSSIGTCLIEQDNFYYIAGTKNYADGIPGLGKINIIKMSVEGVVMETFELNEITTGDTDIDDHQSTCGDENVITTCAAYKMVVNNGDLLVASEIKRTDGVQGTKAKAIGKIYRLNIVGVMDWESTIPVVVTGANELLTYDLKIGITNTFDGGYAITSTMHDFDLYGSCVATPITYYPGSTYTFPYDQTKCWNADAYVAKFNATDNMQWYKTYPIINGYGTYFPNDIKRMEYVYQILETQDHGFVVAGNSAKNFDDDLVIKIYNDCSIFSTYNTAAGDIDVVGTYNINFNTTWGTPGTPNKIRGIIQVNSGVTLTINNNAVIEFADSKSANRPTYILVKRGGRLIIENGAKLTSNSNCNVMWDGIYVEGLYGTAHPTATAFAGTDYYNADHGFVWIKSGATIENARVGISLGLPAEMGNFPNYGGGIIIADDANFVNNSYDIFFHPFNKNNVGFIRHCNFITNALLKDDIELPIAHINMIQVKNLNIRGNYFENSTTDIVYPRGERGEGIHGFLSAFNAIDNPNAFALAGTSTTGDPNIFIHLNYGVYGTQGPLISDNIIVDGNTFENNHRGIYLGATTLGETNRNTFNLSAGNEYGLYYDGSTGYGIEENIFNGPGANVAKSPTGLIINESGSSNNIVYRNTFNNLKFGSKAQNNNGSGTGSSGTGLVFKCNNFTANQKDIAVLSGTATGKIKEHQGECLDIDDPLHFTSPANNLFTDPTFSGGQLFATADVSYILYTFHRDIFVATAPFAQPGVYSASFDPAPPFAGSDGCPGPTNFNQSDFDLVYCPTNFPTGGGGSGRMANQNIKSVNNAKHFPVFSPYQYAKEGGTEYLEFNAEISRNMLAGFYMEKDYTDSLISLLTEDESAMAQSINAEIAVDSGAYTEAEIIAEETADAPEADEEGFSSIMQSISISLASDTLSWQQMHEPDLQAVENIALQTDREGIQSQLILELINAVPYNEPNYDPIAEITEEDLKLVQEVNPVSTVNTINIYPHPIEGNSIVEVNLDFLGGNDRFIITDIRGKMVTQFLIDENISYFKLNNTILQPGVYIGYVQCDGCKNKLSKQIVVIK